MRLRVSTELWAASLLATLGIAPVACGGRAQTTDTGGEGATGSTTAAGGTTAGSGASGGTGAVGNNPFPCESPTPIGDSNTGFVQCANGFVARPFAAECPSSLPRANPIPSYDPATDLCQYDSDCTEKPNGYCGQPPGGGDPGGDHWCQYGCVNDGECGVGYVCFCDDPVGRCVEATCTSDASCGAGLHCASYDPTTGCDFVAFACQTSADECATPTDCSECDDPTQCRDDICNLDSSGKRACSKGGCAIGRPFLVDEVARMAGVTGRSDWREESLHPNLLGLDAVMRERLATDWLRAARLEHASIAAFSRFLLELLAFGAPAELVALTIQAMDDERRHAKLCFALASEYAGTQLGPTELDLGGALPAPTLERSLVTAIREGCVGETVAALEAAELGARVSDPVLRSALTRIAADEKRHAELAFRFVEWALATGSDDLHALVAGEIERVRRGLVSPVRLIEDPASSALARCGISSECLSRAVRIAALETAVLPALEGLLDAARPRHAA
jgi:hypothetical protein